MVGFIVKAGCFSFPFSVALLFLPHCLHGLCGDASSFLVTVTCVKLSVGVLQALAI